MKSKKQTELGFLFWKKI